jgi:ElaB/YqjD/DUF883 family membrane-anchored ribosome-binding protein
MENHSTESLRDTLTHDVNVLKRDVAQLAQDVKTHAETYVASTRDRLQEKVQSTRDALSERPLLVLTAVFVLGYILGHRGRR